MLRDLGALGRGACGSERGSDDIGVQVERALRAEGGFLGGGGAWLALHDLMSRQYWEGVVGYSGDSDGGVGDLVEMWERVAGLGSILRRVAFL